MARSECGKTPLGVGPHQLSLAREGCWGEGPTSHCSAQGNPAAPREHCYAARAGGHFLSGSRPSSSNPGWGRDLWKTLE